MMIIGCDLHTRYQQIAMLDTDTGELVDSRASRKNSPSATCARAVWCSMT
jgi:hypothetical protein